MNLNGNKLEISLQHYFLFALIGIVFCLIYSMMVPFLNSIIMGIMLSFLFKPLNNKFLKITKGKKNLSAFFSSLTLAFLVVIPILFILVSIIFQGVNSFEAIYKWIASGNYEVFTLKIQSFINGLQIKSSFFASLIPDKAVTDINFEKQILGFFSRLVAWLMGQGSKMLGGTLNLGISFFLMMVVFFVMIRDQKRVLDKFLHVLPLKLSQEKNIINKTQDLFKSVIFGNVFTSLAQGVAGGIGFAIAGFAPVFWGAAIAFASLIPVVGTALIWIPASLWLFISGRIGMGIFVSIWFIVVVGLLDNILRPMFIKGGEGMGPVMIFFSILGGINLWGLIGLIYGPMLFVMGFILIYVYSIEFHEYLKYQDEN